MRETGIYTEKTDGSFTYRAAAIIIKDGKFLAAKSKDYPCYYTVGGVVELHETSEEAVIREVFEETGYTMEIDRLAVVQERFLSVDGRKCHEVVFFYTVKIPDDFYIAEGCFTDQPPKETLHWISLENMPDTNIVPPFLKTKSFDDISGIEHMISRE